MINANIFLCLELSLVRFANIQGRRDRKVSRHRSLCIVFAITCVCLTLIYASFTPVENVVCDRPVSELSTVVGVICFKILQIRLVKCCLGKCTVGMSTFLAKRGRLHNEVLVSRFGVSVVVSFLLNPSLTFS